MLKNIVNKIKECLKPEEHSEINITFQDIGHPRYLPRVPDPKQTSGTARTLGTVEQRATHYYFPDPTMCRVKAFSNLAALEKEVSVEYKITVLTK